MPRLTWTPEMVAKLRECAAAGMRQADAARALGVSEGAVKHAASRFGITFKARSMFVEGNQLWQRARTTLRTCARDGCDKPVPAQRGPFAKYCSPECSNQRGAQRLHQKRVAGARGAAVVAARSARARAFDGPQRLCPECGKPNTRGGQYCCQGCANTARRRWHQEHPGGNRQGYRPPEAIGAPETRQQPPPRPRVTLAVDPAVVILPTRPAPVRVYHDTRRPTPFQDDLNAIADHGSPGPLPAVLSYTPSVSTLA